MSLLLNICQKSHYTAELFISLMREKVEVKTLIILLNALHLYSSSDLNSCYINPLFYIHTLVSMLGDCGDPTLTTIIRAYTLQFFLDITVIFCGQTCECHKCKGLNVRKHHI